jgi:hypothetical protein
MLLSVVALVAGLPLAPALAADTVVQLTPATQTIAVGQTTTVTLQVQNVTDLYGYQVEIAFDPAVVEVIDADPAKTGVQAALGSFLKPDFVFRNEANNTLGTFVCAVSQLAPSTAVSGSGTLLTLSFRGKADGVSSVRFTSLMLANMDGEVISTSQQNAQIEASSGVTPPPETGTLLTLRNGNAGGHTVVEVWAENIEGFYSVDLTLAYDPTILQGVSVMEGSAFTDYPDQCTISEKSISGGLVQFAAEMICIVQSGDLQLAVITFDTASCGTSPLTWQATELLDIHDEPIAHTAVNSSVVPYGCAEGATGHAFMQGRTNHSGIEVSLIDSTSTSVLTDADGTYEFTSVLADTYDVMMSHNLYLSAKLQGCLIEGDTTDTLPDVTLLGGDLNGDKIIDISDLTIGGSNFNTTSPAADVNGSGYVDIFDIVLIGINFGATGPTIHNCNS